MPGTLNDDAWLNILQYVDDMADQLALRQVCRSLQVNVECHWRHLKTTRLNRDNFEYFEQNPNVMHQFLQCASRTLESLAIKRGCTQFLEAAKSYEFPKLRILDCDLDYKEAVIADEESLMLTQLFPNLRKLTIQTSGTGNHIWGWRHLQELHLICCEDLETSTFDRIFGSLPLRKVSLLYYGYNTNLQEGVLPISLCPTLEEITIDDHHLLGNFMNNLLQLPKLRRIAFYTRDYYEWLLQSLAKTQPLRVTSLLFNDALWENSKVCDNIQLMTNLRRFVLCDDDIEVDELYKICGALAHLEELHLIKMRAVPTATQLWDIVEVCPNLKVLNLSNTRLTEDFLELEDTCLNKALDKRSKGSVLKLYLNKVEPENLLTKFCDKMKHQNLKLCFEPLDINTWSLRFIEIELKTDSNREL